MAELGKALNANHVVVGQLLKFRTQIAVTIKIIDVNTTTILASHTEKLKDIENLLDKLPKICEELSIKVGGRKYKIGDKGEGGGIVFYIKGNYIYEVVFLHTIATYKDTENVVRNYVGGDYDNWCLPIDDEMSYICYNVSSKNRNLWGKYWISKSVSENAFADFRIYLENRGRICVLIQPLCRH